MYWSTLYVLLVVVIWQEVHSDSTKISSSERLQKKEQVRQRRSYLDNKIDTFPQTFYPASKAFPKIGRSFLPPKESTVPHDLDLDFTSFLHPEDILSKDDQQEFKADHSSKHREQHEPLDLTKLLAGLDDLQLSSGDLDLVSLPSLRFVPQEEEVEQKENDVMEDFLKYLDLKASGALDACLKR